jgi:hypothetical protein
MKTANHRRTPGPNNRAFADLDDCLKRKLQNPDFRAAFAAEDKRIALARRITRPERERCISTADERR